MSTTTHQSDVTTSGQLRLGTDLMTAAALGFVGYAVIFFARNFTGAFLELGIGPDEVPSSRAEIQAFDPDLYEYIAHLHIAVAGFIAATGVATAALAWYGARQGEWWAYLTAVIAPVLGLAVALPAHYVWGLATIGHLGLIYLATLVFVVGAALTLKGLLSARPTR